MDLPQSRPRALLRCHCLCHWAIVLATKAPSETLVNIPDVITVLGSAAIGALAGLSRPLTSGNIIHQLDFPFPKTQPKEPQPTKPLDFISGGRRYPLWHALETPPHRSMNTKSSLLTKASAEIQLLRDSLVQSRNQIQIRGRELLPDEVLFLDSTAPLILNLESSMKQLAGTSGPLIASEFKMGKGIDIAAYLAVEGGTMPLLELQAEFETRTAPSVAFSNAKAVAYSKDYCGKEENSCGVYLKGENKSDCAHFLAHCLAAGGIKIKNPDPANQLCPHGLAVRVVDLVEALKGLSAKYSNVTEIDTVAALKKNDYGFFRTPVRPSHAFLVCNPAADADDLTFYAHSSNRCCTKGELKWYQYFGTAFRIGDA
jgi:hypothetical protein